MASSLSKLRKWKTKDGQLLMPSEMEESHVVHTINFLARKKKETELHLCECSALGRPQNYCLWHDFPELQANFDDWILLFKRELSRRGVLEIEGVEIKEEK